MSADISRRVLDILEWDSVIEALRARCSTGPGSEAATAIRPLEREGVGRRLRAVSELKNLISQGESPDLSGIADISGSCALARKGGLLKIAELCAVRDFALASERILQYLKKHRGELSSLEDESARLAPLDGIGNELSGAFTESGELSDARFPELRRIRDEIRAARQQIEKQLGAMIYSPALERAIQEKVLGTRNERYVILVKANMRNSVPGAALDISSSGATLFIEPEEIRAQNNALVSLSMDLQVETHRILKKLSSRVGKDADQLEGNLELLANLDLLCAAARLSISLRGSEPDLADEPIMRLYGARHPLLYLMHPDTTVPSDISLGSPHTCLVVSGANTGGKTVLLKTIGLCALLALHGLHLPASPDSAIGLFGGIMADIGDDQSIAQSLSTYSGQIVIIKEMMERADAGSLVLIDEIVVGTNPRQGAALAQAVIEQLADSGARMVVTTHYPELKELASYDDRFVNASVSFDLESLSPTYALRTGLPGSSYTLEIARTYGIPAPVLARAAGLLDERELNVEALLESTRARERELEEERAKLDTLRGEAARERARYLELQERETRLMEEIRKEKGIDFLEELKSYRTQIAEKIKELQGAGLREAGKAQQELSRIQDAVIRTMKGDGLKRYAREYASFDPREVKPGDRVFVIPLEKEGRIESIDPRDESAELILGSSLRTRFGFNELLRRRSLSVPSGAPRRKESAPGAHYEIKGDDSRIPLTVQTRYNTVDLRGKRVDEAIERMEADFDSMIRSGVHTVVVIHGHGTGALKEAVRSRFKSSSYVRDFRPGERGEGGDGVSIVFLRD